MVPSWESWRIRISEIQVENHGKPQKLTIVDIHLKSVARITTDEEK